MSSSIAHYCQKCLAANPLGTDFCGRCGTRLMLVVQPTAARFEAADAGVSTNEHLLERISATENRITRLAERLERGLDLVLRQAQNSSVDRSLVKALIDVLSEEGLIKKERLEQLWTEQCEKAEAEQAKGSKRRKAAVNKKRVSPQKKQASKRTRR
ncbi:MAG TPA: zinc ribbon domain-containing protein [Pyrinomonadaceae bacterium]|nr:zinc ribbon domain-containing protein [Pyrinomonadaceae bacterium]